MSELGALPGPSTAAARRGRRDAVDFWRGFVLVTIFVNHVPGNLFERLTYRNLGWSDSAEAFVFISGLSLAMAYGRRFVPGGRRTVLARLLTRAAKLYGAHIGLSMATADGALLEVHGRDLFVSDPWSGVAGLLTLGHQLGYANILPNYVLLIAFAPVLFWLAHRSLALMLGASGALYLLCRATGFNLPTWPVQGGWFFDPAAWQLMMAIGIAVGFALGAGAVPRNRPLTLTLTLAAAVVVAFAGLTVTDGLSLAPGFQDWARGWADLDKSVLGSGRLVHFLALAYLINALNVTAWVQRTPVFAPLCTVGRHGLAMFSLLSVLAAVGQVVGAVTGHSLPVDAALIGGGLALLYATAHRLDRGWRMPAALRHGPVPLGAAARS